jgi:hypothetical protein
MLQHRLPEPVKDRIRLAPACQGLRFLGQISLICQ